MIPTRRHSEYTWCLLSGQLVQWEVDDRDAMKTFLRISKKGENNEQWIIWEDIEKELDHTVGLQKKVDLFLGRECW